MSTLVLFGAGASYGAGNIYPKAPPLGKDLYRELEIDFPSSWGSLPAPLRNTFYLDFEEGMNALWSSGSHAIPLLMQHLAVFFSKYRLRMERNDSYSTLFDNALRSGKKLVYSSLNYDCLFEIAASQAGKNVKYFDESASLDSDLIVWKLHGSCNFLPEGGVAATRGVTFSPGVSFSTGIKAVDLGEVPTYCHGNTGLYPVMAIYAQGKPVQIASDIIKRIQDFWTSAVQNADTIVVIGVNPHPPDQHVWGPLAETKSRLVYVGDERAFAAWATKYRPDRESIYLGNRFSSSIGAIMAHI